MVIGERESSSDASLDSTYYCSDDLKCIARALGMENLPSTIAARLEDAVNGYTFASLADREPSRAALRASLDKIAGLARRLGEELNKLDGPTSQALHTPLTPNGMNLEVLAHDAEQLRDGIPSRGGEPKLARRQFIAELADVYRCVTGEEPTRRHDAYKGIDYGPFLDFVRAALTPIDPEAVTGIEHEIRAVLQKRTSR